jgi:hypothetical protein
VGGLTALSTWWVKLGIRRQHAAFSAESC